METGHSFLAINLLVCIALVSIVLVYGNNRWASPIIAIFSRWMRWILFAGGIAFFALEFGWSDRPFWILAICAFLFWFLIETMLNWFAIQALSRSSIPLFPRFSEHSQANEWPVQKRFLHVREWLRKNDFQQLQSLKADLGFGLIVRNFIFQSADNKSRVQVVFIPQRSGNLTICFSFDSTTETGLRIVTDNFYTPFGGFYPDNWRLVRKTWTRRIQRLSQIHSKRLRKSKQTFLEWDNESPLEDLNGQQLQLERLNTELGFLYPYDLREEYGKITTEGCYRVWKEVWLLNYFGKSVSK